MRRTGLLLTTCALLLSVAQAQEKQRALTAQDYTEIQQLYAQYCHGFDSGADKGQLLARVFTPDGALVGPDRTTVGRDQLAEQARRVGKGPTYVRHFITNILIEPSPEGATGLAYYQLVEFGKAAQLGGQRPGTIVGGGIYRDVFVKTSEGWRIKRRAYYPAGSAIPAP